jgi:CubicO group peptidase (beta-lactamase class C family)
MKTVKKGKIPKKKISKKKVLIRKKPSLGKKIDDIFKEWDKHDSPGMALAVRHNGNIVYRRGYGMADLDHNIPNQPDTVFHAASLTKQFTAMAIMMLINHPNLATRPIALNTNVHTLIPELSGISQPITIGQLLHHISGIRDQWVLATMAGWRLSDDVVTRDDVMKRFVGLSKSLNFAPGAQYSYSNTNYTLAAEIVKKVSGHSLSAFCEQHIFRPLGMAKTKIIETHGEIVNGRAYGYRVPPLTGVGWEVRMPNYDLTGPTNLQTTVEDLMRWDANFDTMTVGGAAAFAAMLAKEPNSADYGLGLFIENQDGFNIIEHNGRDAGYRSHLIRFPDQKLSIALLCNVALPGDAAHQTWTLVRKVAALYLGRAFSAMPTGPAAPPAGPAPANLGQYFGHFYSDELDVTYTLNYNANGSSVAISHDKSYQTADLTALTQADSFKMLNFSVVLPIVRVDFKRSGGAISGFYMNDISGAGQLSNFHFRKMP